jgi:hypothetical protein
MKVKDLVSKLQTLNQNLNVIGYTEDASLRPTGHGFRLFEVEYVDTGEGEWTKHEDGLSSMKFGKSDLARKVAFLHITSDF